MEIEDALFYLALDASKLSSLGSPGGAAARCAEWIGVGVDIIEVRADAPQLGDVAEVCAAEDALCIAGADGAIMEAVPGDGAVLGDGGASLGLMRAVLPDKLVGVRTGSLDDAQLALETGADFLVYEAGQSGVAAREALRDHARVPVYMALDGMDAVAEAIAAGVVRVALRAADLGDGDPVAAAAKVSRMLGRSV